MFFPFEIKSTKIRYMIPIWISWIKRQNQEKTIQWQNQNVGREKVAEILLFRGGHYSFDVFMHKVLVWLLSGFVLILTIHP